MPVTGTPLDSAGATDWLDTTDADAYFATRHGIGALWSDLTPAQKAALLITAQQPIENDPRFTFPDEPTQAMKDAVCEQAFFMLLDPDMELRQALQAQGVTEANLVMERYRDSVGGSVPLAPRVLVLLKSITENDGHEIALVR